MVRTAIPVATLTTFGQHCDRQSQNESGAIGAHSILAVAAAQRADYSATWGSR